MTRLLTWLALAAIVVGIAGLAVTTERASAQIAVPGDRFDLQCSQTVDPQDNNGIGEVECTLSVTDLPPPLGDIALTIVATYEDVDGSNDPSPGDRLLCVTVTGPTGELLDYCRPGVS